jgi:hypothetical protein
MANLRNHSRPVVLVEATAKKYKGTILIGGLVEIVGLAGMLTTVATWGADSPMPLLFLLGGVMAIGCVWALTGAALSWWHHG